MTIDLQKIRKMIPVIVISLAIGILIGLLLNKCGGVNVIAEKNYEELKKSAQRKEDSINDINALLRKRIEWHKSMNKGLSDSLKTIKLKSENSEKKYESIKKKYATIVKEEPCDTNLTRDMYNEITSSCDSTISDIKKVVANQEEQIRRDNIIIEDYKSLDDNNQKIINFEKEKSKASESQNNELKKQNKKLKAKNIVFGGLAVLASIATILSIIKK